MAGTAAENLYYYYRQLSAADRTVYTQLLTGLKAMQTGIACSCSGFDAMKRAVDLVLADHPEIFWFGGSGKMTQQGSRFSFQPEYTVNQAAKAAREKKIGQAVSGFVRSAASCRSDAERLEKAYTWLVETTVYDAAAPDNQNICSVFLNHRSVCAGYAKSLQYLLQQMGMECLYVSGTAANRGAHAWNIVRLDGKYYHTDVTFGDRTFSSGTPRGNGLPKELEPEYAYLCMSDGEAFRDRRMNVPAGMKVPACPSEDMSWYRRNGLLFSGAGEAWQAIARSLARGQTCFCCQFTSQAAYDVFLRDIGNGKFAKLAIEKLRLRSVSTSTSSEPTLRYAVGWLV